MRILVRIKGNVIVLQLYHTVCTNTNYFFLLYANSLITDLDSDLCRNALTLKVYTDIAMEGALK